MQIDLSSLLHISLLCVKFWEDLCSHQNCHATTQNFSLWVSSETVLHPLCERYTSVHLCYPLSCYHHQSEYKLPPPPNHWLSWPPKQIVQQVLLPTILSTFYNFLMVSWIQPFYKVNWLVWTLITSLIFGLTLKTHVGIYTGIVAFTLWNICEVSIKYVPTHALLFLQYWNQSCRYTAWRIQYFNLKYWIL